jgi:hypothetical protein
MKGASKKVFYGMQRKARGAQNPRHINWIGEGTSTAQRCDAPVKWVFGGAL